MTTYFTELNFPQFDFFSTLTDMLSAKKIDWGIHKQICINTTDSSNDNIHYGAASLIYNWDNLQEVQDENGNTKQIVPKREIPLDEFDFTTLCSVFENTVFQEAYNILSERYIVGRTRLMLSEPKTCLSWHKDSTSRIHYPIKTQEGCFMVIEDQVKYLESNKWYHTDTTRLHTAFNGSKESRIHLVAVVKEKQ